MASMYLLQPVKCCVFLSPTAKWGLSRHGFSGKSEAVSKWRRVVLNSAVLVTSSKKLSSYS